MITLQRYHPSRKPRSAIFGLQLALELSDGAILMGTLREASVQWKRIQNKVYWSSSLVLHQVIVLNAVQKVLLRKSSRLIAAIKPDNNPRLTGRPWKTSM